MTCTPMTKQRNGRAITTHPNVWYMLPGYPWVTVVKPHQDSYIPTTRMILLAPASPLVGMTGMVRNSASSAAHDASARRRDRAT